MDGVNLLLIGAFVGLVLGMIILKPHPPIITPVEYAPRDRGFGGGCGLLIVVIATIIVVMFLGAGAGP